MEEVVLVNPNDEVLGSEEKIRAHERGLLHRAFSVIIFNNDQEMLIQRRASDKYHSPNLWSNACCSHPRPSEEIMDAVKRRLSEEIGLTSSVEFKFKFQYTVEFDNGLTENELDYVFVGVDDSLPVINEEEASEYKYVRMEDLKQDVLDNPDQYTAWFKLILKKL